MKSELQSATYWYEGHCPDTGELLRLPRTREVEAIAQQLMAELRMAEPGPPSGNQHDGKMYGLLLTQDDQGQRHILKAFSGLLAGEAEVPGWVPPIPGRDRIALREAQTLSELEVLKQRMIQLKQIPERSQLAELSQQFEQRLRVMGDRHRANKQQRQQQRQQAEESSPQESAKAQILESLLEALNEQSRRDGIERRNLKREQKAVLGPLKDAIAQSDEEIRRLKQTRKALSRQLQSEMHAAYSITNFGGRSQSLAALMPDGLPTGTGDCCAPKLLHAAATRGLRPIAMAEFWWGSTVGEKVQGQFYGACEERCQPLMGFLLSGSRPGLSTSSHQNRRDEPPFVLAPTRASDPSQPELSKLEFPILYEDEFFLAIDKPAGLLSVPGRTSDRQDSVLSRLRNIYFPDSQSLPNSHSSPSSQPLPNHQIPDNCLLPIHRLDQATSGILLFAKDPEAQRSLRQQFEQRRVQKQYEALLVGSLLLNEGEINLPLWGDPSDRPRQRVHWHKGKPSLTQFRVLARENDTSGSQVRVAFTPVTGRTHQLRVHAREGLGCVILGDHLYGCTAPVHRLHLHAKVLSFRHFHTQSRVELRSQVPF